MKYNHYGHENRMIRVYFDVIFSHVSGAISASVYLRSTELLEFIANGTRWLKDIDRSNIQLHIVIKSNVMYMYSTT